MTNQKWAFGNYAGLDFSTSTPTPTSGFAMATQEGCASVSDENGDLLFYTDGTTIWNSSHQPLPIPPLKGGSSSTQSATIVPAPGSNGSEYYIFTIDGSSAGLPPIEHFNGGRLNIQTWQFTPLSALMTLPTTVGFSPAEKLVAIQHRNCRDFWIVTVLQVGSDIGTMEHEDNGVRNGDGAPVALMPPPLGPYTTVGPGVFRVFEVTPLGVTHRLPDTAMNTAVNDGGYLKASPDGRRLAIANGNLNVLIYPFDNATGLIKTGVSDRVVVPLQPGKATYGLEFSPKSQALYYGDLVGGEVRQIDLLTALPPTSPPGLLVGTFPNVGGPYAVGALQLGPDGRIYVARDGDAALGAILNPDTLGTGCNVVVNHLTLPGGAISRLGLPNMITSRCADDCHCGDGCHDCNKAAATHNAELIARARAKSRVVKSSRRCTAPFSEKRCTKDAVSPETRLEPCFYFHWGDGANDQIEEHDTEVFYITVCNPFRDVRYKGLRITGIRLVPTVTSRDKAQVVPDRFIDFGCLEPCTCQTREFALITRANDTAGKYALEIQYCYDELAIVSGHGNGVVQLGLQITED